MADALFDTDIVIDLLRGHPQALQWATTHTQGRMGISSVVWFEVIQGAQNRNDQEQAQQTMQRFELFPLEKPDNVWAMQQFLNFRLSHNIGIHDVLIAAIAMRLGLPLYTRNIKHYSPLPDVQAIAPY